MSSEAKITVTVDIEDEAIQQAIAEATSQGQNEAIGGAIGGDVATDLGTDIGFQTVLSGMAKGSPTALLGMLGPLLGPAAALLLAPIVIDFVFDELTRPGGLMDTRFRRDIEKEQFGFYNRQLQYDTQYGYRNVIIQGHNSFISNQGNFHASTFRDIMEGKGDQYRLSRIEISDKALGIRDY